MAPPPPTLGSRPDKRAARIQAARDASVLGAFTVWTNKGGVGKTTLTYHMATSLAGFNEGADEAGNKLRVLCVDMCPQGNLSSSLLSYLDVQPGVVDDTASRDFPGPTRKRDITKNDLVLEHFPRTVGGYILSRLVNNGPTDFGSQRAEPADFLVQVSQYNSNLSDNLFLLCGDSRLDSLAGPLLTEMDRVALGVVPGWEQWHNLIRNFILGVARKWKEEGYQTVVFIDTNPALTTYTELAICAADSLIVPCTPDEYANEGLANLLHQVYGLNSDDYANPLFAEFEEKMFGRQLNSPKFCHLRPPISIVIRNQHMLLDTEAGKTARVPHSIGNQGMNMLETAKIHHPELFTMGHRKPKNNSSSFNDDYTVMMADFASAGILCTRFGIRLDHLNSGLRSAAGQVLSTRVRVSLGEQAKKSMRDLYGFVAATLTGDGAYKFHPLDSKFNRQPAQPKSSAEKKTPQQKRADAEGQTQAQATPFKPTPAAANEASGITVSKPTKKLPSAKKSASKATPAAASTSGQKQKAPQPARTAAPTPGNGPSTSGGKRKAPQTAMADKSKDSAKKPKTAAKKK